MIDFYPMLCRQRVSRGDVSGAVSPLSAGDVVVDAHGSINDPFPGSYYQNEPQNTAKVDAKGHVSFKMTHDRTD